MQRFNVETGDEQPLMTTSWGSSTAAGYTDLDRGAPRNKYLGPIVERWYSLSPKQRTWIKRGSALVATGLAVWLIVVLVQSSSSGAPVPSPTTAPPAGDAKAGGSDTGSPASPAPTPPSPSSTPPPPKPSPSVPPPPPAPSPPPPQPPVVAEEAMCSWASLYLPTTVEPARYDLSMTVIFKPNADAEMPRAADNKFDPRVSLGKVQIRTRLRQATRCIVLHAAGTMQLGPASYTWNGTRYEEDLTQRHANTEYDQIILHFPTVLPATTPPDAEIPVGFKGWSDEGSLGVLELAFSYDLKPGLDGFYTSQYTYEGATYTLASTQFESVAARKAFPCFDEPRFKARLQLRLSTLPDVTVLSNMPVSKETRNTHTGLQEVTFHMSPPMSTYLYAWVIGNLDYRVTMECVTETTHGGLPLTSSVAVSAYAAPHREGLLDVALSAACVALQTFTWTLGVQYPLTKLDLVALPEFAAGAMENWGLITYRESSLLVPPGEANIQQQLRVNVTVAHEISHQWFGNLVTCADWPELWLNEGLATYMENVGADAMNNATGWFSYLFLTENTLPALRADSLSVAHPLSSHDPVGSLSQIDNYFDDISYAKGGAVLRMLRAYLVLAVDNGAAFKGTPGQRPLVSTPLGTAVPVPYTGIDVIYPAVRRRQLRGVKPGSSGKTGPFGRKLAQANALERDFISTIARPNWETDVFFASLKTYLEQHAYHAVNHTDLWRAFDDTTQLPVSEWMAAWTETPNYPLVHATTLTNEMSPSDPNQFTATFRFTQHPVVKGRTCGPYNSTDNTGGQWWIPVFFSHLDPINQGTSLYVATIQDCETDVQISLGRAPNALILVNAGRLAPYRVEYSPELWNPVVNNLDTVKLVTPPDYAGTLSDAYRAMEQGPDGVEGFIAAAKAITDRHEIGYTPWAVLSSKLQELRVMLDFAGGEEWDKCRAAYNEWVRHLADATMRTIRLVWAVDPADSALMRAQRTAILGAAGAAGNPGILDHSLVLMAPIWQSVNSGALDVSSVHPDIRPLVYCLSQKGLNLTEKEQQQRYSMTKKAYLMADDASERRSLLTALTCTDGTAQHSDLLTFLTTPDVRLQDVGMVLTALGQSSSRAFTTVWDAILNATYFQQLIARWPSLTGASYSLGLSLKDLLQYFSNNEKREALLYFADSYKAMLDPLFIQIFDDCVQRNVQWHLESGAPLCERLLDMYPPHR